MTATVAQLGARALRKLGVAIVASGSGPQFGPVMTTADIAVMAVRELGIVVSEADRPDMVLTAGQTEIAARALRNVGGNPFEGVIETQVTIAEAEIATRALLVNGINPATGGTASTGTASTSATMATLALLKLSVIAPEETPTAADQATALYKLIAVHDSLVQLGYVTWDINTIPAAVTDWYLVMTANMLAPEFGRVPNLEAYGQAQEAIRQQALSGTLAQARALAKVQTVHDALNAESIANWNIAAIPDAVGEAYVMMVAQLLAPIHGRPQDMDIYNAGMAQVRRYALSGARGQALAEAKVQAVHDALNAAALVSWPVSNVPVAYVEDYVTMTTTLLAPVYKAQDPAEVQVRTEQYGAAMDRLRKAGMVQGAQARAAAKVQALHDELNGLGLVTWDVNAIPSAIGDAYAGAVAAMMDEYREKPLDPGAYNAALSRVRRYAMGGAAGQALAEQKVRDVHASLDARGLVRWTLYDLPDYAERPYVDIAATWLAPEVDVKADPAWEVRAEMDLARMVSVPSRHEPVRATYF